MMDTFSVLAVLFLELGLGETLIDANRGERVQREGERGNRNSRRSVAVLDVMYTLYAILQIPTVWFVIGQDKAEIEFDGNR